MGQLRSGVQKANYQTAYGPVMEQARKQGTGEMLARGAMGLFGGPVGMALAQLGTKEYGLPGVTGFERFDPNNPNPGGGILGQFLGGLNPTQAKDALVGAFAPVVPAPEPTSIGTAPADLKGFENRFSQHPLTGEKTAPALGSVFEVDGRSFIAGKNGPIELKGAAEQQVVSPSPLMNSFAPETELRTPTEQYARETGQLAYPSSTSTDGYNYTMDAPSYLTDTSDRKAQAQNVGLVDYTNLTNTGNNLYRSTPDPDLVDKAFEFLGIRDPARRSSGQIKGSTINSTPLFNFPEFKFSDYYPF